MRPLFLLATTALTIAAPTVYADSFKGRKSFPQFRNLSGLSGGGFGVTSRGSADIGGALSLSTPIGYSLTDWHLVGAFGNLSANRRLRWPTGSKKEGSRGSNGTVAGLLGVPIGSARLTVSGMILSGLGDSVLNLQLQVPYSDPKLGISVGAQDVFSTGGAAGEGDRNDDNLSRSLFLAVSYPIAERTHATLGIGTERFRTPFGNISYGITPRLKAAAEYDGYGINGVLAYSLGKMPKASLINGRPSEITMNLGLVRGGRNAYWGVSFSF